MGSLSCTKTYKKLNPWGDFMKRFINRFKLLSICIVTILIVSGTYLLDSKVSFSNISENGLFSNQDKTTMQAIENNRYIKEKNVKLLSTSNISKKEKITLIPGGQPLGIKLKTDGALVVALSNIENTEGNLISPASEAGIQIGDIILKLDNYKIDSVDDITYVMENTKKEKIDIVIERNGKEIKKNINVSQKDKDGNKKLGLWVRDSTAGVGTLTFYDPIKNKFGALGHPITDSETGNILNVKTGEIISSNILSVKRGMKGNPGELRGMFIDEENSLGKISKNTICGIFGTTYGELNMKMEPMEVGYKEEIQIGDAYILSTIKGKEPKLYKIKIDKLLSQNKPSAKSMIIKVTDEELLKETGGIVQGMSGSPIIQNGKIIGAVTHVLVNKPDIGYGIYIEWMLNDAEILNNN